MGSKRSLCGYIVVRARPFETATAIEAPVITFEGHPAFGFYDKKEAEDRARALQQRYQDPWILPAEVRLPPEPEIVTAPKRVPGTGDIP